MRALVVDAGVAVQWVVEEEGNAEAAAGLPWVNTLRRFVTLWRC